MCRIPYRFLALLARLAVSGGRSKDLEIIVLRHQFRVPHRRNRPTAAVRRGPGPARHHRGSPAPTAARRAHGESYYPADCRSEATWVREQSGCGVYADMPLGEDDPNTLSNPRNQQDLKDAIDALAVAAGLPQSMIDAAERSEKPRSMRRSSPLLGSAASVNAREPQGEFDPIRRFLYS